MQDHDDIMNELNDAFSDAIARSSERWPTDATDEDYDELARGDLFQLNAETMPYAVFRLMTYFLSNSTKGRISQPLEMFIGFLDIRDPNDDEVPFKTDNYDELYAYKLEQLALVTSAQSKAISAWLQVVAKWCDIYEGEDDDEDDDCHTIECVRQYWARRGER